MAVKNVFKYRQHEPLKSAEKVWVYLDKALQTTEIITTTYSPYAVENVKSMFENIRREDFNGLDERQFEFIHKSLLTVTLNKSELNETLKELKKLSEGIIASLIVGRKLYLDDKSREDGATVTGMNDSDLIIEYADGQKAILNKENSIGYLYSVVKDEDLL